MAITENGAWRSPKPAKPITQYGCAILRFCRPEAYLGQSGHFMGLVTNIQSAIKISAPGLRGAGRALTHLF
jgi:hypothetical protein